MKVSGQLSLTFLITNIGHNSYQRIKPRSFCAYRLGDMVSGIRDCSELGHFTL